MVPWRIRLLLSFVSIVTAALICIACLIVAEGVLDGYLGSIRTPAVTFAVRSDVFFGALVLIVRDVRGWRFWLYLVLGSCVGPLLMLALFVLAFFPSPHGTNSHWIPPELRGLIYLAATISILATLFYLLLLRRMESRATADPSTRAARSG
jgi:drug/metabolite transporter (DMT)-like permease